jgi:diguanylate cyclase (GGDEF)-like protein/PAS domain S-box-containing protein
VNSASPPRQQVADEGRVLSPLSALRISESRYRRLFETARDGILLLNADTGQIEDVNPYLVEMLGYTHEEFLGKKLWEVGSFADIAQSKEMFAEVQASGYVRYEHLPLRTRAGARVDVEFVSNAYYVEGLRVIQCNIRDISERRRMEDQVREMAFHDALTRLPNRRLLNDRLMQAMAATRRNDRYGVLMFLDLDEFKLLNDAHGHSVGDLLLIQVAERLTRCVREMDTVARFGGDEFVVLLADLQADEAESRTLAEQIAEKIRLALSRPYSLRIRHLGAADRTLEYRCTVSIGVALFNMLQASPDNILQWADTAMYQAKDAGGNVFRVHAATGDAAQAPSRQAGSD